MSQEVTQVVLLKPGQIKCPSCEVTFCSTSNLYRHTRRKHQIGPWIKESRTFICYEHAGCTFRSKTKTKLLKHLESQHNIKVDWVSASFSNLADFELWFDDLQAKTKTRFRNSQTEKLKDATVKRYLCNRQGRYCPVLSSSERKRFLAQKGIQKNQENGCSAHLNVRIDSKTGAITVRGSTTHHSHHIDGRNLGLLNRDKAAILELNQQGLTPEQIVHHLRATSTTILDEGNHLTFLTPKTVTQFLRAQQAASYQGHSTSHRSTSAASNNAGSNDANDVTDYSHVLELGFHVDHAAVASGAAANSHIVPLLGAQGIPTHAIQSTIHNHHFQTGLFVPEMRRLSDNDKARDAKIAEQCSLLQSLRIRSDAGEDVRRQYIEVYRNIYALSAEVALGEELRIDNGGGSSSSIKHQRKRAAPPQQPPQQQQAPPQSQAPPPQPQHIQIVTVPQGPMATPVIQPHAGVVHPVVAAAHHHQQQQHHQQQHHQQQHDVVNVVTIRSAQAAALQQQAADSANAALALTAAQNNNNNDNGANGEMTSVADGMTVYVL